MEAHTPAIFESREKPVADVEFIKSPDITLPDEVVRFIETHNLTYLIHSTDLKDILVLITDQGTYQGNRDQLIEGLQAHVNSPDRWHPNTERYY